MRFRHSAVAAFTMMAAILMPGIAATASLVQPSDDRIMTFSHTLIRHRNMRSHVRMFISFSMAFAFIVSMSSAASAFPPVPLPGVYTHPSITETAFGVLDKELFSISKPTEPMKDALKQIVDANSAADKDQYHSKVHFDGENFSGGQDLIVALLGSVIKNLQAENALQAQKDLGTALHTVQDFYAHSNWIELGHAGPNPDLGRPGHRLGPVAGTEEPTCNRFDRGYLITGNLTSGYYGGEDRPEPSLSKGAKCRHGGLTDKSEGHGGINKDVPILEISPHASYHGAAGKAAVQATEQFMRDIRGKVTSRQLALLFGVITPTSCVTYSYTPTIDGSPLLDTLKLSMIVPLCHDGREVWVPSNQTPVCKSTVVRKGSTRGAPMFIRCEPDGIGMHDRTSLISSVYDVMEETPRGTASYQSWFSVDASGRITTSHANLWCSPPDLSNKCTHGGEPL